MTRPARPELSAGGYERREPSGAVWAWRRGRSIALAVNLSDERAAVDLGGRVLLSTSGSDDASGLGPWEGVVLDV